MSVCVGQPDLAMELSGSDVSDCCSDSSEDFIIEDDDDETLSGAEVEKLSEEKKSKVITTTSGGDAPRWKESIRRQMEEELERRVREALETPPLERQRRRQEAARRQQVAELEQLNAHILLDLSDRERDCLKRKRWRALHPNRTAPPTLGMSYLPPPHPHLDFVFRDELAKSNQDEFPGVFGLDNLSEGIKNVGRDCEVDKFPPIKCKAAPFYTKEGLLQALRTGRTPEGVTFIDDRGTYMDKYGIIRNQDGPFWPPDNAPLFPTPRFRWWDNMAQEPLAYHLPATQRTADNQETQFGGRWRGILIVYDSERSARDQTPPPHPTDCCPSLIFESRFESGNLRQARRTGQFDYELVLRTDLYTNRHTQWYYFRVQNMVPGVTYRFRVVNLLKRNSLYNLGMRPLLYSEKDAQNRQIGWRRTGHHISYSRNVTNLHCPLLQRGVAYYMLEWQMEFEHREDTCYLAHCYPYTFTDLKEDLDTLQECEQRSQWLRREVLCETRAGNSCFLLTITNFEEERGQGRGRKKAVVVTARVHPGESQASWMMKGLLDFLTSTHTTAQELRSKYVFKVVPMLNPDGVIVGNYRCSLAARDLNRNYRHPRRESFPTVWHTKNMLEELMHKHEVLLYCDLHGHSRKHNVFMYGNNLTTLNGDVTPAEEAGPMGCNTFISERLIPWLMSVKAPDKFSFASCKFHIKKCKESTGRVVMWRQMRIRNSFTLEAAFSGTTINNCTHRHFNTSDFMAMGKTLGEVVLEYAGVQDSKMRQTETVLDLTRAITHQVLESRGLLPNNFTPPSLDRIENLGMSDDPLQQEADRWTMALINLLSKSAPPTKDAAPEEKVKERGSKEDKVKGERVKAAKKVEVSKKDVDSMLEKMSFKTLDGCMRILAQLNVRESIEVSDSSDSDSESEPEMPRHSDKNRKKKRRSKKNRDREQERKLLERKAEEQRSKSLSAGSSMDRYARLAKQYNFMSKYEGRSNGGVPCFTEERSMERQAKRLAEMKRKTEEDRQRELSFYVVDGAPCYCQRSAPPAPLHPLQRALTQEDLSQKLQAAIAEGTPNLSQTLSSVNVRTGYTHADNFRDLTPTVQPVNGLSLPSATVRDRNTPMLKAVTRQIVTPADTPPLLASGILPPSRSPAMESDRRETRLEERPRVGRTSGSLHAMAHEAVARCLAGSPHGEGIRYRSISEMSKLQADSITREYMKLLLDRSHR